MSDEAKIAAGLALIREGTQDIPVGSCPVCGGGNISSDETEQGLGEVLYELCSCEDCGCVWRNHYEIFQQEIISKETGSYIDPGEYKMTEEYRQEVTTPDLSAFDGPEEDDNGEECPLNLTCGGCGKEFTVPPGEDPHECPFGDLIDSEICPECADLCERCHKGEFLCQKERD